MEKSVGNLTLPLSLCPRLHWQTFGYLIIVSSWFMSRVAQCSSVCTARHKQAQTRSCPSTKWPFYGESTGILHCCLCLPCYSEWQRKESWSKLLEDLTGPGFEREDQLGSLNRLGVRVKMETEVFQGQRKCGCSMTLWRSPWVGPFRTFRKTQNSSSLPGLEAMSLLVLCLLWGPSKTIRWHRVRTSDCCILHSRPSMNGSFWYLCRLFPNVPFTHEFSQLKSQQYLSYGLFSL